MKYLLDTNVLVAMFRKHHNMRQQILDKGIYNCAVSEATLAELKVGAYKTNDITCLVLLFLHFNHLDRSSVFAHCCI